MYDFNQQITNSQESDAFGDIEPPLDSSQNSMLKELLPFHSQE